MKTYIIIDAYSLEETREWKKEATTPNKVRIVIVHNYIEEYIVDEDSMQNFLMGAVKGKDYLVRN